MHTSTLAHTVETGICEVNDKDDEVNNVKIMSCSDKIDKKTHLTT